MTGEDNSGTLKYSIGICQDATDRSSIITDCCQNCVAPILICDSTDVQTTSVCWSLGNMSALQASLVSSTDPSKGVVIDYGDTSCCPGGISPPGVTKKLPIKLLILASCSFTEGDSVWRITMSPSFVAYLRNCSGAPAGTLEIRVESLVFFWKLSSSLSNVTCVSLRGHFNCTILPVWAGNSSTATGPVCLRLKIELFYTAGHTSKANMSTGFDLCTFVVWFDTKLTSFRVVDEDAMVIGPLFNASHYVDKSWSFNPILQWALIGLAIFCGTGALVLSVVYCWGRRGFRLREYERIPNRATEPVVNSDAEEGI